jgi:hypothetical protein
MNSKLIPALPVTLVGALGAAVIAAVDAIRTAGRKLIRTAHAMFAVTRRHVPAWVGVVLTVALLIPGPVDELLVLVLIAGFAAFKPEMRADFAQAIPTTWKAA